MALIYVVEDDEPICRELVDILARAGFALKAKTPAPTGIVRHQCPRGGPLAIFKTPG